MAKRYGGKRNALKHGAYVREILPGERLEEFKALHRGLIKEWKPSGTLEEQTVMSLARAVWCKDRVNRFYYDEAYWVQEPEEDELNYVDRRASGTLSAVHER